MKALGTVALRKIIDDGKDEINTIDLQNQSDWWHLCCYKYGESWQLHHCDECDYDRTAHMKPQQISPGGKRNDVYVKFLKRFAEKVGDKITTAPEGEEEKEALQRRSEEFKRKLQRGNCEPLDDGSVTPTAGKAKAGKYKAPPPHIQSSRSTAGSRDNHIADQAIATGSTSVAPIDGSTAVARIQEA